MTGNYSLTIGWRDEKEAPYTLPVHATFNKATNQTVYDGADMLGRMTLAMYNITSIRFTHLSP